MVCCLNYNFFLVCSFWRFATDITFFCRCRWGSLLPQKLLPPLPLPPICYWAPVVRMVIRWFHCHHCFCRRRHCCRHRHRSAAERWWLVWGPLSLLPSLPLPLPLLPLCYWAPPPHPLFSSPSPKVWWWWWCYGLISHRSICDDYMICALQKLNCKWLFRWNIYLWF